MPFANRYFVVEVKTGFSPGGEKRRGEEFLSGSALSPLRGYRQSKSFPIVKSRQRGTVKDEWSSHCAPHVNWVRSYFEGNRAIRKDLRKEKHPHVGAFRCDISHESFQDIDRSSVAEQVELYRNVPHNTRGIGLAKSLGGTKMAQGQSRNGTGDCYFLP